MNDWFTLILQGDYKIKEWTHNRIHLEKIKKIQRNIDKSSSFRL